MTDAAVVAPPSPYKGLAAFADSEVDALLFFGREREIEVIAANLIAARLTLLYGPSGVGKTSLLRAGVAHKLRNEGAAIAFVSTWSGDPIGELLSAVEQEARRAAPDVSIPPPGSLAEVLSSWTRRLGADLYLVLDQFEEYFLYHGGEGDAGPLTALADLIREPGARVHVLLSIREDALALLDVFKSQLPGLFGNSLRLDRLHRPAATRAIRGPLERHNELAATEHAVDADDDLVEEILDSVEAGRIQLGDTGRGGADAGPAERGRIEAPYLQLVLERLWEVEFERGSKRLQVATLRELGGASRIVEDHLERAMAALTPGEKDAAAAMYNHLVTPSGTKIAHRAGDLARYASVDESEAQRVLQRLAAERIVRSGENGSTGPEYEIFHDVLAEAVLAWRTRHEADRRVEEERREAANRNRRLLGIAFVLGAVLVIVAAAAVYAISQRNSATSNAREARAHDLAALAEASLVTKPERSLELALQASGIARTPTVEEALRRTLLTLRVTAVIDGSEPVSDIAYTPDGSRLAVFGRGRIGGLFETNRNRRIASLRYGQESASTSADGTRLTAAGADGWARLWDAHTGKQVQALRHPGLTGVIFAPTTRLVGTTGPDGRAVIWDARSGRSIRTLRHPGAITSSSFSHDGRLLVTTAPGDARGSIDVARVFDVRSGRLTGVLHDRGGVARARFGPRGDVVVTWGKRDHLARLWSGRSGRLRGDLRGHVRVVLDAAFSTDGRFVATASADGTARVWSTSDERLVSILPGHPNWVTRVEFSPDGELIVTGCRDHLARIFDADSGTLRATLAGHTDAVTDVAFQPNGRKVATGSADGSVRIWDARLFPELMFVRRRSSDPIKDVAFTDGRIASSSAAEISPDGRFVASRLGEGIRVAEADSGRVVHTLPAHPAATSMSFAGDSTRLVVGDADGRILVWRLRDGRAEDRFITHPGVTAAAASIHADRLVLAEPSGPVRSAHGFWFWNARTHKVDRLLRLRAALTSASFSPDDRFVITTGTDREARLFDAASGRQVWVLSQASRVSDAAFSADGRWVVIAGPGYAGVVDAKTGERIMLLKSSETVLTSIAMSETGWRIAAGGRSGGVWTYDCRVCGGIDELVKLGEQRLAQLRSTS